LEKDGEPAEAFPLGEISCPPRTFPVLLFVAVVPNIVALRLFTYFTTWAPFWLMKVYAKVGSSKPHHMFFSKPLPCSYKNLFRLPGDCDYDDDCEGFLICFFRDYYDDVPGCLGGGEEDNDYCIDPFLTPVLASLSPTVKPTQKPTLVPTVLYPQTDLVGDGTS